MYIFIHQQRTFKLIKSLKFKIDSETETLIIPSWVSSTLRLTEYRSKHYHHRRHRRLRRHFECPRKYYKNQFLSWFMLVVVCMFLSAFVCAELWEELSSTTTHGSPRHSRGIVHCDSWGPVPSTSWVGGTVDPFLGPLVMDYHTS